MPSARDCVYWLALGSNGIGQVIETVMIVFLTFEFCKPKSEVKYAYYYILYISYWTDTIDNIVWWSSEVLYNEDGNVVNVIDLVYKWYFLLCPSAWSVMLSLNRCTAMGWPLLHNKIWTGKSLTLLLTLTVFYPFLVDGRAFRNFRCMYEASDACSGHHSSMMTTFYISTATSSAISFLLIAVAVVKSKKYSQSSAKVRIERRMIIHAATASVMLLIWVTMKYLADSIAAMHYFFDNLSFFVFFMQHYLPMLLILFINSSYRNLFFRFIGIDKLIQTKNIVSFVPLFTICRTAQF